MKILGLIKKIKKKDQTVKEVDSFSGVGTYKVNLKKLKCNCPDFNKRRKKFSMDDSRRLCKHLMKSIDDPYDYYNFAVGNQVDYFQGKGIGFPCNNTKLTISVDNETYTAYIDNDKEVWIDIFDEQDRYGFNVEEQRWSYGTSPSKGDRIIEPLTKYWIKIHGEIDFKPNPYEDK